MQMLSFSPIIFAFLAGASFLLAAYAHFVGGLAGHHHQRFANVGNTFGFIFAVQSIAAFFVPPYLPAITAFFLFAGILMLVAGVCARKKLHKHNAFFSFLGDLMGANAVTFAVSYHLGSNETWIAVAALFALAAICFTLARKSFRAPLGNAA